MTWWEGRVDSSGRNWPAPLGDCGSVASPYRETESMIDGSDAIEDWTLLNADGEYGHAARHGSRFTWRWRGMDTRNMRGK